MNFGQVEILVFLQLIFEMIPLSSSGQIKLIEAILIKKGFFENSLNILSENILKLSNLVSDFVVLFFFRRKIPKLSYAFFEKCMKMFLLSGVANCITMLLFVLERKLAIFAHLGRYSSKHAMIGTLTISMLINASNFLHDFFWKKSKSSISPTNAIIIGFCQGLALFRGISRLGITYTASRWLGIDPNTSLIFSFLLHFQISLLYSFQIFILEKGYKLLPWSFSTQGILLIFLGILLSYWLFAITFNLAKKHKFYLFSPMFLVSIFLLIYFL